MKQNHTHKINDEELIDAFENDPHIGKIAALFSLPHITVWRRLNKLKLKCSSKGGSKIPLSEILDGQHPYYQTFKLNKRLVKEKIFENQCDNCKITNWNNIPIRFQLDHKNGDSSDHRLENLRLLCPNCHSQTDTWCGKNK